MYDEELVTLKQRDSVPFTDLSAAIPVVIIGKTRFCRSNNFYEVAAKFGHWLQVYGGVGKVLDGVVHRQFTPTPFERLGRGFKCATCQLNGELLTVAVVDDGNEVHIHLVPDVMPNYREYGDWDNFRIAPMRERLKLTIDTWLDQNPIAL